MPAQPRCPRVDPESGWPRKADLGTMAFVTVVDVGQAKTELWKLVAMAEAGEEVEIARDGVPVVRLVPIQRTAPGQRFLASKGVLAGQIRLGADFEFTDAEPAD